MMEDAFPINRQDQLIIWRLVDVTPPATLLPRRPFECEFFAVSRQMG
jgi:hypothetical protein